MVTRVLVATLVVAATAALIAQTVNPVRVAQGPTKVCGSGTTTCSEWIKIAATASSNQTARSRWPPESCLRRWTSQGADSAT